ncbi:hypothetical protein WMF01_47785 [Sorangium sp. So ce1667]
MGSGFEAMRRAGKTAIASSRCMSCATWRRVAVESFGSERMTFCASSSENEAIGIGPTIG